MGTPRGPGGSDMLKRIQRHNKLIRWYAAMLSKARQTNTRRKSVIFSRLLSRWGPIGLVNEWQAKANWHDNSLVQGKFIRAQVDHPWDPGWKSQTHVTDSTFFSFFCSPEGSPNHKFVKVTGIPRGSLLAALESNRRAFCTLSFHFLLWW